MASILRTSGGFIALDFAFLPFCSTFYSSTDPEALIPDFDLDNFEETVTLLLDACPDVNAHDSLGATPLLYSICVRDRKLIRTLLESGAHQAGKNGAGRVMVGIVLQMMRGWKPEGMVQELARWGLVNDITIDSIQDMRPFFPDDLKELSPRQLKEKFDSYYFRKDVQAEYLAGSKEFQKLHYPFDDCRLDQPCFECEELYDAYHCSLDRRRALQYCKKSDEKREYKDARYCYSSNHGTCNEETDECICHWMYRGLNCEK